MAVDVEEGDLDANFVILKMKSRPTKNSDLLFHTAVSYSVLSVLFFFGGLRVFGGRKMKFVCAPDNYVGYAMCNKCDEENYLLPLHYSTEVHIFNCI